MTNLAAALIRAQKEFPPMPKDGKGNFGKHVTLHTLFELALPVLHDNDLALTQYPTTVDGQPALRTRLTHAESGEYDEDTMLLVLDKNNPQGQGSGLTYARRYAALSILGLVADDDDDGQAASKPAKKNPTTATQPSAEATRLASQAQKNRLHAIMGELAKQRGVDAEQVKNALKGAIGVESFTNLTVGDAAKADALLETWKKKVAA